MQKNWYAVYTRPNCEKKVALLLTKKKIDNFCPQNCKKVQSLRRNKVHYEPLFKSYVFVNISDQDISLIRQIDGVINFLYWRGIPAIIQEDEIEAIKEFIRDHKEIELFKTIVNTNDIARIIDGPSYSIEGKLFALKNKVVKLSLPSLGYVMVAKMQDESIFGREATFLQNNSFSHS